MTGESPLLALVGGSRDASCAAVLRVRYNSSLAQPTGAGGALVGRFRLIRTDQGAPPLNAEVLIPSGYDSVFALPAAYLGSGVTVTIAVQAFIAGDWRGVATVPKELSIPPACATSAVTPVFNKPDGTTTSGSFIWVQVYSPTPGGFLYVTTDGTSPRTSSTAMFVHVSEDPARGLAALELASKRPNVVTAAGLGGRRGPRDQRAHQRARLDDALSRREPRRSARLGGVDELVLRVALGAVQGRRCARGVPRCERVAPSRLRPLCSDDDGRARVDSRVAAALLQRR